ncbi:MAG: glycosyltransferase family 1 protein, partial [Acidobacteriota bacterium]
VLPKQMRQLGTQVFHAPYFITTYRAPCPMVVGLYDTIAQRYPHNLPSGKARLAAVVGMRFALRSAKTVLTLSRFAKDDLAKTLDIAPERIVVTPGAPPDGLQPATPDAIDELRERLRLPERYMLHVGTNKPHKNLERLVEAWAELQKTELAKSPSVEFGIVFAGAHDPQYPEPKAIGRRLGATGIHCLGHVAEEDLPALYSGAELFILPSLDEGFGLPILEAMACGTAVACSRRASLPEVAGHAAIYFDPESAQSITEALARVIKNPSYRKVLGDRGRIRAGQLTWKHTARLTLDAYRRAAAG